MADFPYAGMSGTYQWDKRETNDFEQAGALYRLIDEAAKQRLVGNIADGLAQVSRREIVDRSVSYFRNADPDYGERVARAIAATSCLRRYLGPAPTLRRAG